MTGTLGAHLRYYIPNYHEETWNFNSVPKVTFIAVLFSIYLKETFVVHWSFSCLFTHVMYQLILSSETQRRITSEKLDNETQK